MWIEGLLSVIRGSSSFAKCLGVAEFIIIIIQRHTYQKVRGNMASPQPAVDRFCARVPPTHIYIQCTKVIILVRVREFQAADLFYDRLWLLVEPF